MEVDNQVDLESIGSGAATGFLSAVITLLGWNRRLLRLEEEKADKATVTVLREEITNLKSDTKENLKEMRGELTYLKHRIDAIYERVVTK